MSKKDTKKKKRAQERFEEVHSETSGMANGQKILVDKETGMHYLYSWSGYSGGITPLLDAEGKSVIKKKSEENS